MSAGRIPADRDSRPYDLEARLPPEYRRVSGAAHDRDRADTTGGPPKRPRVRYMPPLDAPSLSQLATKSGFLTKQADNETGKWTKYFFVLKPTTYLYYYNTELDADPRGILDLEFLQDVRFNADCVHRSVGGSANAFRVTGQLPEAFDESGHHGAQLRPLYLDADSPDAAREWMEAIRHHRFDLVRYNDYDELVATMERVDEGVTSLTKEIKTTTEIAQRIRSKATEYLANLRGEDDDDNASSREDECAEAALRAVGELLDDIFAEADQQRRLAHTLREHENQHYEQEAEWKVREAGLQDQASRCQQLERELKQFESRHAELLARENRVHAQESELEALTKQRDREFEQKLQSVQHRAAELMKEVTAETARCNAELEKRRKAMDKQQRSLDQKQELLSRQLEGVPSVKVGMIEAVRKSLANTVAVKKVPNVDEKPSSSERETIHDNENSTGGDTHSVSTAFACGVQKNEDVSDTQDDHESVRTVVASNPPTGEDGPEAQPKADECTPSEVHDAPNPVPAVQSTQQVDELTVSHYIQPQEETKCLEERFTSCEPVVQPAETDLLAQEKEVAEATSTLSTDCVEEATSTPVVAAELPFDPMLISCLPPEWTCKESKSYGGRVYYFNLETGETRWDFPHDVLLADPPKEGSGRSSEGAVTNSVEDARSSMSSQSSTQETAPAASRDAHEPSKLMYAWRSKLLGKVQLPKRQSSLLSDSSPRSLLDDPVQPGFQKIGSRCEF